jgi:hypothetical protein
VPLAGWAGPAADTVRSTAGFASSGTVMTAVPTHRPLGKVIVFALPQPKPSSEAGVDCPTRTPEPILTTGSLNFPYNFPVTIHTRPFPNRVNRSTRRSAGGRPSGSGVRCPGPGSARSSRQPWEWCLGR